MVYVVLNLSKNNFSRVSQEWIDWGVREVNHVRAFSDKVLGKALHNMASSLVIRPMADL